MTQYIQKVSSCFLVSLLALVVGCSSAPKEASPTGPPAKRDLAAEDFVSDQLDRLKIKHWPYELEGCMNTRDQFLAKTSKRRPKYSTDMGARCNVIKGEWVDYLTGAKIKDPSKLVVTSVIPLEHVLENGGKRWSFARLHAFSHDPDYLIVLQKKGSSGQSKTGEDYYNQLTSKDFLKVELDEIENRTRKNVTVSGLKIKKQVYCEIIGLWRTAKAKWNIKYTAWGRRSTKRIKKVSEICSQTTYDRKLFDHWSRVQGYDCNARVEALIRDSKNSKTKNKWQYLDQEGHEEARRQSPANLKKLKEDRCQMVVSGNWWDPYTNKKIKFANEPRASQNGRAKFKQKLDVDHVVPLKHAYSSGAWQWPRWKKEEYANYLVDRNHLLSVSSFENQSKAASDPSGYMPPNRENDYHCKYLSDWLGIKWRWALQVHPAEETAILKELETCPNDLKENLTNVLSLLRPYDHHREVD